MSERQWKLRIDGEERFVFPNETAELAVGIISPREAQNTAEDLADEALRHGAKHVEILCGPAGNRVGEFFA